MMDIERTEIDGVLIVRPKKFADARGYFAPVLRTADMMAAGVSHGWVQENQSLSRLKGTVRGLHFQRAPFAQAKLVRVVRGAAMDVCVDLRVGSPTHGRHVAVELTADNLAQVYIPAGFAHGFCTLCDDTEVLYKVSADWSVAHEDGVRWNDPALGIDWPVAEVDAVLSDKDRAWPGLTGAADRATP
jgi:dTDP-4-dehydrorhamnose 3,5-epimerase